ncbi:MAG: hypothetical protein PVF17_05895 [Ignavibacteria bacterium]|jgi:hypothetical protein
MTDLFGVKLNVGDEIIYTTGAQSNTKLERGHILEIDFNKGYRLEEVALIKTSSGRTATNWRYSDELVSVNPIKQSNPELFI